MADEEEDYMSEAFLQSLQQGSKQEQEVPTTRESMPRNRKTDAETVLLEGLAKPLGKDNIGFKLLSKMGYKQPDGERKNEESKQTGPVEIFLKRDRTGVGIAEEERKQAKVYLDEELKKVQEQIAKEGEIKEQYLKTKGSKFETRKFRGQLIKLRQIESNFYETLGLEAPVASTSSDPAEIAIEELDQQITANVERGSEVESGEVEPMKVEPTTELVEPDYEGLVREKVLKLREAPFCYCFYCGARYNDKDDLLNNCPGETEQDHD